MVSVFSFCLYGPENPLYYRGLLENIYLAAHYFPDWKVYVYLGKDVTENMRNTLMACSSVVVRDTDIIGSENMIHRFYAIDEPDVDVMIVRDADSRIHWKDRWAIRQFLRRPNFVAHVIRDNNEHRAPMMGGLWGMRKLPDVNIHNEFIEYCKNPRDHGVALDQNFLAERVYPRISHRVLVHCSHGISYPGETAVEFPFAWSNETFCGRPEGQFYIDRPEPQQELRILREGAIHRRQINPIREIIRH